MSTLAVSVAASSTDLTTLQSAKDELGISGASEDTYLGTAIDRASAMICSYLGVAVADDGTCTLGRETLVETFRLPVELSEIMLARWPVTSITSVVEDGETLAADEYEIDKRTGILRRLDGDDNVTLFSAAKIVVTYVAGYKLPGEVGRNLPHDIEAAVLEVIKAHRSSRTRDPLIKAEETAGLGRIEYWVGSTSTSSAMPPEAQMRLDAYRRPAV